MSINRVASRPPAACSEYSANNSNTSGRTSFGRYRT
jgi:hypothetical protein